MVIFSRLSESCCPCELKEQLIKYRKGRLPSKVGVYKGKLRYTGVSPVDEVTLSIENMQEIARFFAMYINVQSCDTGVVLGTKQVSKPPNTTRLRSNFTRNLRVYLLNINDPDRKRFLQSALTYKFYTDSKFKSAIRYDDVGDIVEFPEFSIELPDMTERVFTLGEILSS